MSSHKHDHEEPTERPKVEHVSHDHPAKGPHDPKIINPKLASDIAFWSHELHVTGDQLHEAIRSHGTHIEKIRAALHKPA